MICALRLLLLGARIRLRAGHQRNRESTQEMLLFPASGAHQVPTQGVPVDSFSGRVADHSIPSIAEVRIRGLIYLRVAKRSWPIRAFAFKG
jgi:hypothetical protein